MRINMCISGNPERYIPDCRRKENKMKNEEIVLQNRFRLMTEGIIGSTGQMLKIQTDDGEKEVPEPEVIHTYAGWLDLGYRVRHGQHAIAEFPVWKMRPAGTRKDKKTGAEVHFDAKMMLCNAFWFSSEQVKPIEIVENTVQSVSGGNESNNF